MLPSASDLVSSWCDDNTLHTHSASNNSQQQQHWQHSHPSHDAPAPVLEFPAVIRLDSTCDLGIVFTMRFTSGSVTGDGSNGTTEGRQSDLVEECRGIILPNEQVLQALRSAQIPQLHSQMQAQAQVQTQTQTRTRMAMTPEDEQGQQQQQQQQQLTNLTPHLSAAHTHTDLHTPMLDLMGVETPPPPSPHTGYDRENVMHRQYHHQEKERKKEQAQQEGSVLSMVLDPSVAMMLTDDHQQQHAQYHHFPQYQNQYQQQHQDLLLFPSDSVTTSPLSSSSSSETASSSSSLVSGGGMQDASDMQILHFRSMLSASSEDLLSMVEMKQQQQQQQQQQWNVKAKQEEEESDQQPRERPQKRRPTQKGKPRKNTPASSSGRTKRPLNAYNIFCKQHFDQVKRDNPQITSIKELSKLMGRMWKQLSEEERRKYHSRVNNAPRYKKPLNAYNIFCKRHFEGLKREHPTLCINTLSKIIAQRWKKLSKQEQKHYYDEAAERKRKNAEIAAAAAAADEDKQQQEQQDQGQLDGRKRGRQELELGQELDETGVEPKRHAQQVRAVEFKYEQGAL